MPPVASKLLCLIPLIASVVIFPIYLIDIWQQRDSEQRDE